MRRLDSVESAALTYLVALDLSSFEAAYTLGTDHPNWLGYSDAGEDARPAAFPDRMASERSSRCVSTGMVPPNLLSHVAAAFTSGFKREHGAFVYGPLAAVNHASHYGFISNGVVFEHVAAGTCNRSSCVATARVEMKTWTEADNSSL